MKGSTFSALAILSQALIGCTVSGQQWFDDELGASPWYVSSDSRYQDSWQYSVKQEYLYRSIQDNLLPLNERVEKGEVSIQLMGPELSEVQLVAWQTQWQHQMLMPIDIHYERQESAEYQVILSANLQPKTCRYQYLDKAINHESCVLKRNQFRALSNAQRWSQGAEYLVGDSNLEAGAVQRLYQGKVKVTTKQSTQGEE